MPELLIERGAERDLRKLPASIFKAIVDRLQLFKKTARPPGAKKLSGRQNDWRIRVGDYRVIYEIDDLSQQVRILRVRHRREVYR